MRTQHTMRLFYTESIVRFCMNVIFSKIHALTHKLQLLLHFESALSLVCSCYGRRRLHSHRHFLRHQIRNKNIVFGVRCAVRRVYLKHKRQYFRCSIKAQKKFFTSKKCGLKITQKHLHLGWLVASCEMRAFHSSISLYRQHFYFQPSL